MILLGTLGFFQILISIGIIGVAVFYVYSLVKLWQSSLSFGSKILYTIVSIVFPIIGLLLLLLVHYGVLFNVTSLKQAS